MQVGIAQAAKFFHNAANGILNQLGGDVHRNCIGISRKIAGGPLEKSLGSAL